MTSVHFCKRSAFQSFCVWLHRSVVVRQKSWAIDHCFCGQSCGLFTWYRQSAVVQRMLPQEDGTADGLLRRHLGWIAAQCEMKGIS